MRLLIRNGRVVHPVTGAVLATRCKNLHLIPANIALAAAEIEMVQLENRAMRLRRALLALKDRYDYLIIDCPPSLGLVTINALTACDSLLIPIQCEYFALEGLSQLRTAEEVAVTRGKSVKEIL